MTSLAPQLPGQANSAAFDELVARVQACRECPTMAGRRRVLGPANGRIDAQVLFVAEAPGRLGGDRTGVPLTSDQTGRNFSQLLSDAGISRDDVFITNAVLCNPRTAAGLNRAPARAELERCRTHLRVLFDLVAAPLVVTLGAVALAALDAIEPHGLTLRADVAHQIPWRGRTLLPLYHPGPRARIYRTLAQQREDFAVVRATIARSSG